MVAVGNQPVYHVNRSISPASAVQRVWDNPCCVFLADQLLDAAVDGVERARYSESRAPGSGDWLHTLPLSSIGLKWTTLPSALLFGLRLGAPIVRPHVCVSGTVVTVNGHQVATAQDDIHATIKSTRSCVMHFNQS